MTSCTERISKPALGALLMVALAACSAPGPRRPVERAPAATAPIAVALPSSDKGDADARFKDALTLMKARKYAEAQAAFVALSTDYPNLSGPLTDLGILYAQSRQNTLAMASLTRAVKANPGNAVALSWLGTLHRESGDFASAEQDYRRAIAAKPDYAPAYLNLAILYDVSLRRPHEALLAYQEYQRRLGREDLIVAAWIRDLEARVPVRTASAAGASP